MVQLCTSPSCCPHGLIHSQALCCPLSIHQSRLPLHLCSLSIFVFWGCVPGEIDQVAPSVSPSYPTQPRPRFSLYTSGWYRQDHPSASLTHTSALTSKGVFCKACVHSSLVSVVSFYAVYLPVHLFLCASAKTPPTLLFVDVSAAMHGAAPPLHYHQREAVPLHPFTY